MRSRHPGRREGKEAARLGPVGRLLLFLTGAAQGQVVSRDYSRVHPAIAWNPVSDQYLVVWEDHHKGARTERDIYGRRLSGAGAAAGDLIPIGVETTTARLSPAVACGDPDGSCLVVREYAYAATDHDIHARRVAADGTVLGPELFVGDATAFERTPAVTWNAASGEYLVVRERRGGSDEFSNRDIRARRVGATGDLGARPFPVTGSALDDVAPAVASDPASGRCLVVWQARDATGDYDIAAQRLGAAGTLQGSRIDVVTWEYDQVRPRVAFGGSRNEFLVVREDHHWGFGADLDIYGQRVHASGTPARAQRARRRRGRHGRRGEHRSFRCAMVSRGLQ